MARSTSEWRGKSDDSKAPTKVRDRVFERHGRICHLCRLPIKVPVESWDLDHIVALINGGENAEANLAPAHKHCHIAKTGRDVAEKKKVAHVRQKHTGARKPKQSIKSRSFDRKERKPKPPLPRRSLFGQVGALWGSGGNSDEG